MTLQHPYCRTCGSKVQSKNVCNHCGCEPGAGKNYCCDCGTTTIPQAIMCVECGASFQRKFPAVLALLISIALVIILAGAGYFIAQNNTDASENIGNNITPNSKSDLKDDNKKTLAINSESQNTIVNKIPEKFLKRKNDAIIRIAKSISSAPINPEKLSPKPIVPEKIKVETTNTTANPNKNNAATGRISMNTFSSRELNSYAAGCTYFEGRSKNNIVFFTTNVYGYIKVNGKIYALQGVQKGNDIARFAGAGYEVTVELEGLAGNENAWLATGTMVIKDVRQRTVSNHTIYSSCTDF